MEIHDVLPTDLFVGSEQHPLRLIRATLVNRGLWMARDAEPITVWAQGPGTSTPEPVVVTGLGPGEERTVDIPVAVDPAAGEGTVRPVTVLAETAGRRAHADADLVVAEPGWTMYMVPHFHYDPVWWNTQAGYLALWDDLPAAAQERRQPGQHPAFGLVRAHMDEARRDPDYKFVLAELDYLKPYWDACPQDRAELRELLAAGRAELVGGMYNEPNTNLTSLESTIRNTVYGTVYQRDVIGGDPQTGWMLDVFGHDPAYPAVMADAGLTSSSWARGPFHQWGPRKTVGDNTGMQFPSEFEWIAPDGRGLLTSYMANHYSAGWQFQQLPTLAEAEAEAYTLFSELKPVAATRNVLLPVGADHVIPSRWAAEIHRDWAKRYVWPRFVVGLPREFFGAVRQEAGRRHVAFSPQSRDMNPVYTGKDVSYIDTKQAQRAAETALLDGEKLATLMTVLGAGYPAQALDKAWRQLCFNAHHDGITGTESDQVYLDMLSGWREAYEIGAQVRGAAAGYLAGQVDTRGADRPLLVVNPLSWPRTDIATVTVRFGAPGPAGVEVRDDAGRVVPSAVTGSRHPGGGLAEAAVSFLAADVPATGYRTYRLAETARPGGGWTPAEGTRAENETFRVVADPSRGGALSGIYDKRAGKELVQAGQVAGELVYHDEYPDHPAFAEGPWHLSPNGSRGGTSSVPATVRAETSPAGQRLISTCRLGDLAITQEITLWNGLDRLEFRIHVDGSIGQDRLLRVRHPLSVGGARPVYEVGNAVIGRTFGFPDVDAAEHPWTLDNPAHNWAGLSSTARVALCDPGERRDPTVPGDPAERPPVRVSHAIGVAEIIGGCPGSADGRDLLRDLVAALAQQGVTATTSRPDGPRYGRLALDSNLPDVRVSIGGPADNAFTARVLGAAGEAYATRLAEAVAATGQARVWVPAASGRAETWRPGADVQGERDLPVLIVAGRDAAAQAAAVGALIADLADATVEVTQPASLDGTTEPLEDYSAALLNRGTPGIVVEPSGTVHMSLMRSCSGWPAGVWIDPPRRTAPDGSSFAWQHWSHTFEYALAGGTGDWRDASLVHAGHAYNHGFETVLTDAHQGELPPSASLLEVEPADVVLSALKPSGNQIAAGGPAGSTGRITFRCYDTRGRATTARLRCFVPLRDGAVANVLEEEKSPLETPDGTLALAVGPAQTVTATARPAGPAADRPGLLLGPSGEPVQPLFARYWLHNKGPAPVGYQPVSVHVNPATADITESAEVTVTVSATCAAAGTVELVADPAVELTAPGGLRYDLPAGGFAEFPVAVRPRGAQPGSYHLLARITDGLGQVLEDAATLHVAGGGETAELGVRIVTPAVDLAAGGTGHLRVELTSSSRDEVHGEAQLISPFGSWEFVTPWARGFSVEPGGEAVLPFELRAPLAARPHRSWILVKVTAFGRIHYSESVPLTIAAAGPGG